MLSSPGGGLRPALLEVGGSLLGVGAIAAVRVVMDNGWSVDVQLAATVLAVGVLIAF